MAFWVALVFAMTGCSRNQSLASPVLAEVNGEFITQADLDYEKRLRQFGLKELKADFDEKALLEEMIDRALMLQRAKKQGLQPSQDELDGLIKETCQGYSLEDLKAGLADQGILFSDWQDGLRQQWITSKLVEREVTRHLSVSDQEIKDYYWEHLGEFRFKERRHLRQIVTLKQPDAEKALQEVLLGDSFAQVAARSSIGPEAAQGGDLGLVAKSELPAALATAAFELKKGRPSGIIKSPYGFHILLLEDIHPANSLSLEEATPLIIKTLLDKKQQVPFQAWLYNLRKDAKILRYEGHSSSGKS